VEITGWFGDVLVEGPAWTVLDNAHADGRFQLPFHSDITFVEFPLEGISLYPQALPTVSTSTTYVSNALAWQAVPEDLRCELQDLKARHYFVSSDDIDLGRPVFEYWHPVCMRHPKSGRPLLFVTEHHVDRIEGMAEERCAQVLKTLFETLYAPERRYEHVWRAGDLIIWDNLAIQHARTRVAELADGPRVMRRVQLGKVGFVAQVERLRRREANLSN
jgi:taurine dioxygenase